MADPRTKITAYFNVEECAWRLPRLSAPAAWSTPAPMPLFRGAQVLFCAYLRTADPTVAFLPPSGGSWLFGIDDAFTPDHGDLVVSAHDQFNIPGDWDLLNETAGLICWRANLATPQLREALGSSESKNMYADLWFTPSGGAPTLIAQWNVTMRNIAVDPTTATATEGITFPTTDVFNATISGITTPTGGLYRLRNGALQLWNATQNKWHTLSVSGVAGSETLDLGPGED
jgi:hypothetical protein